MSNSMSMHMKTQVWSFKCPPHPPSFNVAATSPTTDCLFDEEDQLGFDY